MERFRNIMRTSLDARVLASILAVVLLLTATVAFLDIRHRHREALSALEADAARVATLLRLNAEKPLFSGDDPGTTQQFSQLAAKFPGADMSIAGNDGVITYSTRKNEIKIPLNTLDKAYGKEFTAVYRSALEGATPLPRLLEEGGKRKFLLLTPVENDPACYHCHGWSKPVLGATAVMVDVETEMQSLLYESLARAGFALLFALSLSLILFLTLRLKVIGRVLKLEERSSRAMRDFSASLPLPDASTTTSANVFTDASRGRPEDGTDKAPAVVATEKPTEKPAAGPSCDEIDIIGRNFERAVRGLDSLTLAGRMISGLRLPALMCDTGQKIIYANRPLYELLGYSEAQNPLLGARLDILYGGPNPSSIFATFLNGRPHPGLPGEPATQRALGAGAGNASRMSVEEDLLNASGQKIRARLEVAPIFSSPGAASAFTETRGQPELSQQSLAGVFCTVVDITLPHVTEMTLRRQNSVLLDTASRAEQLMRELGEAVSLLAGQIGHTRVQAAAQHTDLCNRTASIDSFAEGVQDVFKRLALAAGEASETRDRVREAAEQARSMASEMREVVRSMLDFREQAEGMGVYMKSAERLAQMVQDMADKANLLALDTAVEASGSGNARRALAKLSGQLNQLAEEAVKSAAEVRQELLSVARSARNGLAAAETSGQAVNDSALRVLEAEESLRKHLPFAETISRDAGNIAGEAAALAQAGTQLTGSLNASLGLSDQAARAMAVSEQAVLRLADIFEQLGKVFESFKAGGQQP